MKNLLNRTQKSPQYSSKQQPKLHINYNEKKNNKKQFAKKSFEDPIQALKLSDGPDIVQVEKIVCHKQEKVKPMVTLEIALLDVAQEQTWGRLIN